MNGLRFRNVDADPADDVGTWPYEALVTAIDRDLVPDWRPVFAEIRRLREHPSSDQSQSKGGASVSMNGAV